MTSFLAKYSPPSMVLIPVACFPERMTFATGAFNIIVRFGGASFKYEEAVVRAPSNIH